MPSELMPDDPIPNLEERLAALHALGPMEFEPGEQALIATALEELDRLSRAVMQTFSSG
jgi:hypothetical protein